MNRKATIMSQHWDEFSKSLVDESVPRRESLRRLGFALAGVVLSPFGLESAFAGKQDPCKTFCKCRNKKQQNQCLAACKACGKNTSRLAGTCGGYSCCAAGQTSCGAYCTDLASDVYNCGDCGRVCREPGAYEYGACINGDCRYDCAEGAVYCDGACSFLAWDPANCGECGYVCDESFPYCNQGECSACPPGLALCGNSCVDLAFDSDNCGGCGNVCGGSTPYCNYGTCSQCSGGATNCNGVCTNVAFDPQNCGGCGIVCGDGETCSGGVCQSPW
jgi:hypothetical protein